MGAVGRLGGNLHVQGSGGSRSGSSVEDEGLTEPSTSKRSRERRPHQSVGGIRGFGAR
jgi:phage tail tape-measure protein